MVLVSKRYALLLSSIYNAFVDWDSIDDTVLPLTDSISPADPNPSVPVSSIDILPPTEKLDPLLTIEAEDTVPLLTSLILANVWTPFLLILEVLSLFASTGRSSWDIVEL